MEPPLEPPLSAAKVARHRALHSRFRRSPEPLLESVHADRRGPGEWKSPDRRGARSPRRLPGGSDRMISARHWLPRLAGPALALFALAAAARPAGATTPPDPTSIVDAVSPGPFVTTVNPSVPVAVTLTRSDTTPILGYSD